jgi:VWFA-related protein
LACLVLACSLFAQTPPPTFRTGAQEVLLDVVVRDKKGQLVTNLEPGDLEVYDNGVRRPVSSFRLIQGSSDISLPDQPKPTAAAPAPAPRKQLNPLAQVRLMTLIFNRLDLNSRQLARTAGLDLLKNEFPENVYMSVFVLGDSLQGIQAFTNDRELLRKAVTRATSGAYTEFISDSAQIEAQMQQQLGPATAGESVGEQTQALSDATGGSGGKGPSGDPAGAAMAQMMLNTLMLARTSELAQTGRSAIWGLIDAISQQYRLPGRKSVLFFSSGFGIPQGMEEPWRVLISTANRFNVTFYSIDARGLGTNNLNTDSVSQLKDAASASRANFRKGSGTVTPAMAQAIDTAINSGKANTQNTLEELAQSTGGFLIANTNDFRNQLHKVSEDIETYYQVTYDPQIEKYDGVFRKVEVRSTRPNLRIQSRAGYFALPASATSGGLVLSPFELPLMQALNTTPFPREFAFQSSALHFLTKDRVPESSVVLDVPIANLALTQANPSAPFEGGLSYIALVKGTNGEVVQKFRGEAPLAATPEQVNALKEGHFLYQSHLDLPPGRYTLETAIADKTGNKTSVRKSSFLVPSAGAGLQMSSVSIIRTIRQKTESTSAQDPFVMEDKILTPIVNPVYKKGSVPSLSFYLAVYPDAKDTAKPKLTMRFSRDGSALGSGSLDLAAPDASGRIQYVATAPVDKLEAGYYTVDFFITQGSQTKHESVTFTLD